MSQWDNVTIEDLETDAMVALAETIGIEAVKQVIRTFGGESIYIPKTESVVRSGRDRVIYQEFNGSNYRQLARKFNLSLQQIRNIVQCQREKNPKGKYRQQELF